jgi:hypothetical protein
LKLGRSYGIRKDEDTFYQEIWPELDDVRAKDGQITSNQSQQNGKVLTFWQLN